MDVPQMGGWNERGTDYFLSSKSKTFGFSFETTAVSVLDALYLTGIRSGGGPV